MPKRLSPTSQSNRGGAFLLTPGVGHSGRQRWPSLYFIRIAKCVLSQLRFPTAGREFSRITVLCEARFTDKGDERGSQVYKDALDLDCHGLPRRAIARQLQRRPQHSLTLSLWISLYDLGQSGFCRTLGK